MALTYALLLVSCDSPFSPDEAVVDRLETGAVTVSLTVGETRPLTVRVLGEGGEVLGSRRIFWSSQNPAVASVSQAGIVTGVSAGSTQLAVSAGGKSALIAVTVASRPVSLVRVNPATTTIVAGSTTALTAEALDAGGTIVAGRLVLWGTSNQSVATVTSNGVVTGVAAGSVNITATVDGVVGTAVVTVQPVPVASIVLEPASGSLIVGQSVQLTASPRDANGQPLAGRAVAWSSNEPSIASVSSTGLVTALARGTANITATAEGRTASSRITVSLVPIDTVSVTPRTSNLAAGQTVQLAARLVDSVGAVLTGRTISWDTDQPTIATVGADGLVTAISSGRATITASAEGRSGTAIVNVSPVPVASLTITPGSATLFPGGTQQLTATARDAVNNLLPGRIITWISGAPSVATVTQGGLVTAVGTGSALIFAASEGISTSVTITVSNVGVAQVRVAPAAPSVQQGRTVQLTATALDAGGQPIIGRSVTWNSANPTIASASSTGLVTGIAPGTASVTATIDGVIGTADVTVTATPVASVIIVPDAPTLTVGGTLSLTALLADATGAPLSPVGRAIAWSTSALTIASVNANGLVTALAPGTTIIQATVEGVIDQTLVTVTNVPVASVALNPSTVSLNLGQTRTITATARDAQGNILTGRPVAWSSSNVPVATVSTTNTTSSNTITAVGAGSATITATIGGVQGVSTVTVTSVPIATIAVTPNPTTVEELQTTQLTGTARDAAGNVLTGRTLVWASSDNAIAPVSQSGQVTANAPGTVTITASAPGQGVGGATPSGTSAVTVSFAPVATASITPNNPTVTVGQTTQPTVTLQSAGGQGLPTTGRTVTWSLVTTPPGAATINSSTGVVTGVAGGTGTITVSAQSPGQATPVTATASLSITTVQVARIAFTAFSGTLHVGTPYARTVTAQAFDAANNILPGRLIAWSTENANISISPTQSTNGQATITGNNPPASTRVIATTQGASGAVADTITVTTDLVAVSPTLSTVTLNASQADSVTALTSNSRSYTSTPRDSAGNVIIGSALGGRQPTWSISSGGSFATVVASGATATVTPVAGTQGIATVRADYGGGAAPTANLKIIEPVANILLSVAPDSFFVGGQSTLVASAVNASNAAIAGRVVALSSSNAAVASLSTASGTQTVNAQVSGASAPGGRATATITATATLDNVANSVGVKVLAPVNNIAVSTPPGLDSVYVPLNIQASATLTDASNNVLTGRSVTWSTGNAQVATVSQSGLVTGVGAGSTPVTASAEGKTGNKTLKVVEAVNSVELTATDSSIFVGQTQATTTVLRDRLNNVVTNRIVTYSSATPAVATVSSAGLISAVGPGTTNITATSEGKTSAALPFTVSNVPVASVTVSATPTPNVYPTHTFPATVSAFDASGGPLGFTGRTIVWTSSNPNVLTVAAGSPGSATVTAVAVGSATISATVDGVAATTPFSITVKVVPVASITFSPATGSMVEGDTLVALTATPRDSVGGVLSGKSITWSTVNPNKVSYLDVSTGLVTAVDTGAATVTATATGQGVNGTNVSASTTIAIQLAPILTVGITPSSVTLASTNASTPLTVQLTSSIAGRVLAGRSCDAMSGNPGQLTVMPGSSLSDATGKFTLIVSGVTSSAGAGVIVTVTCDPTSGSPKSATASVTVP